MKSVKLAIAVTALALTPVSASAEMFKCRLPDGRTAYQDHACAEGAERKELQIDGSGAGGSPLENTISEFVMIHVRRGAHYKSGGKSIPDAVTNCIMRKDASSLKDPIDASIHGKLGKRSLEETNRFLDTAAGHRYSEEVYNFARAGRDDFPRTVPGLSVSEQAQFDAFVRSEVGARVILHGALAEIAQDFRVFDAAFALMKACVDVRR
jgi:uncharacterized protein DUF4124